MFIDGGFVLQGHQAILPPRVVSAEISKPELFPSFETEGVGFESDFYWITSFAIFVW